MIYLLIFIKHSDMQETFYSYYGGVGIGWTKLWISKIKSPHKWKKHLRSGNHFPFPFSPMFNEIKVNLNSFSTL